MRVANAIVAMRDRNPISRLLTVFVVAMAAGNDDDYHNFSGNGAGGCPMSCVCDEDSNTMNCTNTTLKRWPPLVALRQSAGWSPMHVYTVRLDNCSGLASLPAEAFRRFSNVREIFVRRLADLDLIDRHAFKGLLKLRLIEISENPMLTELRRGAFSGIGNEQSIRVRIRNNALKRIRANSFKSATSLRELSVEDSCFTVEADAFAGLHVVDFLTIRGACAIADHAFANTSRVHALDIVDSTLDLRRDTFAQLNHVNQIQLRDSRIGVVEARTFAGAFTVGAAHLQSNRIGRVEPRAFADAENLGSLVLSYNRVETPLESPDCIATSAQKFVFAENTLHCTCAMRWIQFIENESLLTENYCGREASFKPLAHYKPLGCPPLTVSIVSDRRDDDGILLKNRKHNNKNKNDNNNDDVSLLVAAQTSRTNDDMQRKSSGDAIKRLGARISSTFSGAFFVAFLLYKFVERFL